jgi:hypothetical protein
VAGDRSERRHEVIGRLDDHDSLLPRVDAEIGEQLEPERLRPLGD